MKTKTVELTTLVVTLTALSLSVCAAKYAFAQDAVGPGDLNSSDPSAVPTPASSPEVEPPANGINPTLDLLWHGLVWDRKRLDDVIRINLQAMKIAETTNAKAEAKKNIRIGMSGFFDQDMKKREEEIAAIEVRVQKLRDQLDKRREAKSQIIDLQIRTIEFEADGLGMFQEQSAGDDARNPFAAGRFGKTGKLPNLPSKAGMYRGGDTASPAYSPKATPHRHPGTATKRGL